MRVLGTLNLKEEPIESKIIKKDLVKYSIKEIEEKIGEIILYEEKIIFNKNYSFFIFKTKEEYKIIINGIASQIFKNKEEFENQKEQYLQKLKEELKLNDEELKVIESHINLFVSNIFPSSNLYYEDKEKRVIYHFIASDGISVSPCAFFINEKNKAILGEMTYLFSKIEEKGKVEEKITPSLILVKYDNGIIVDKKILPLKEIQRLDFEGKPIKFEKKTISENPLNTLMNFQTVEKFFNNEQIDLKEIYLRLKERISKFVNLEFNPILLDLATCHIIATYFYDVFASFPIGFIYGVFESGKTKLLKCFCYASHKGFLVLDPSSASIYRTIDAFKPSICIDEFTKIYEEVERLVRSAYKKGEKVPRIEKIIKDRMFLRLFEVYSPIFIASIEMIKEMLLSRSLLYLMQKADSSKLIDRDPEPFDFEDIRDSLYLARFYYAPKVYETYKNLDIKIFGREREIFKPILTIAKIIDEEIFNNILNYAFDYTKKIKEEYYQEEKEILEAIERLFEETKMEEISFTSSELTKSLKTILVEEREELSQTRFDKYYTPHKIGRLLTRMGVRKKRKSGGKRERYYFINKKELEDLKIKFDISDNRDIRDNRDINLEKVYIPIEKGEEKTPSKIEGKGEKNQVLEGGSKKDIEKSMSMPPEKPSLMSLMSHPYGICEICGNEKEVFLIRIKKLNKKIAICENCLKEMKEDQYEILNENQKTLEKVIVKKPKVEEKKEEDEITEDYLIFSNKIRKEMFGNILFYVCNFCNFKTLTFVDMKEHYKTHEKEG
jgi:hypothetical protein